MFTFERRDSALIFSQSPRQKSIVVSITIWETATIIFEHSRTLNGISANKDKSVASMERRHLSAQTAGSCLDGAQLMFKTVDILISLLRLLSVARTNRGQWIILTRRNGRLWISLKSK